MYPVDTRSFTVLRERQWDGVGRNVVYLGFTSLLTDVSAEMVASILPIYLVFVLRLSPLQYGLIDGLYQGAAALAGLAAGILADRWRRNREVAASGYALSALCKLGLLAAGNAWTLLSGAIVLDRLGKGLRTAPRDALISLSAEPRSLGLAFGVHRALDTAGALLGPLAACALLAWLPEAYDVVFVSSFCVAVLGLAVLLLFVQNPSLPREAPCPAAATLRAAADLLRAPAFRGVLAAGAGLALVSVADSFFYLVVQRRMGLDAARFPLLYSATAVSFLLLAVPAGRLGDRVGRWRVWVLGQALSIAACATLVLGGSGAAGAVVALGLLGASYACTDGVLMAMASAVLPPALRSTGLAMLASAIGLARLGASVLFGFAWNGGGLEFALGAFALVLTLALPLAARTLARLEPRRR